MCIRDSSQADLISYGMGEHSIVEIADALNSGIDIKDITFIDGTVFKTRNLDIVYDYKMLPDYQELKDDKRVYAKSFFVQYSNTDPVLGKRLVEPYYGKEFVVQNPPAKPLTQEEMDEMCIRDRFMTDAMLTVLSHSISRTQSINRSLTPRS